MSKPSNSESAPEQKGKAAKPDAGLAFSPFQLQKLAEPIDKDHVHVRDFGSRQLSYIEGWYALAQANAIFGYGGWDRETVHFERVHEKVRGEQAACGYLARVRIRVRAGKTVISREGTGWGWATERNIGAAHEKALKTAETDATKRALSTFGSQFGLTLYDKDQNGAADRRRSTLTLFAPDGKSLSDNLSPEAYCSGLRQLISVCATLQDIDELSRANAVPLSNLRGLAPRLCNAQGIHFADLLQRLMQRARHRLSGPVPRAADFAIGTTEGAEIKRFPVPADSRNDFVRNSISLSGKANEDTRRPFGSVTEASLPASVSIEVRLTSDQQAKSGPLSPVPAEKMVPPISLQEARQSKQESDAGAPITEGPLAPSKIALGPRVDKSRLTIGSARRIRDKNYLKQIRELPCTICNRQPSHAHHLKFAQSHGMSQKVSDEYVVPLCAIHHGDLHHASSETSWWAAQKIEPVAIADELWRKYRR